MSFERRAGRGNTRNWKISIRYSGRPLKDCLESYVGCDGKKSVKFVFPEFPSQGDGSACFFLPATGGSSKIIESACSASVNSDSPIVSATPVPVATSSTSPIPVVTSTQAVSLDVPASVTQAASPVVPSVVTQAASPVVPSVVTQAASPVVPSVVTQAASSVIPSVVTQAASPVIPSVVTQAASPVIPSVVTQAASPVVPSVVTQAASPVVPSGVTQAASPVVPSVVTQAASLVVPSVVTQVASSVIPSVVTQAASPVVQSVVIQAASPSNNSPTAADVSSSGSSPSSAYQPSTPSSCDCPLCAKRFSSHSNLWQHINSVHISRRLFPCVATFESGNRLVCSVPSCHWASRSRFKNSGCRRLVNTGVRCGAPLVEASNVSEIPRLSNLLFTTSNSPSLTESALSSDPLEIGLLSASACKFLGPPATESEVLNVLLDHIMVCPVSTISHIPCSVRPGPS